MAPHDVEQMLITELNQRGASVAPGSEGDLIVRFGESQRTVFLDNIIRDAIRDDNTSSIHQFVDAIMSSFRTDSPSQWTDAREHVYVALESSRAQLGECFCDEVTPQLRRALVHNDPQRGLITFLGARNLDEWKITRETVIVAAEQNLSRTLREAEPHIKMVEGFPRALAGHPFCNEGVAPLRAGPVRRSQPIDRVASHGGRTVPRLSSLLSCGSAESLDTAARFHCVARVFHEWIPAHNGGTPHLRKWH
jgi:hypothetical protein